MPHGSFCPLLEPWLSSVSGDANYVIITAGALMGNERNTRHNTSSVRHHLGSGETHSWWPGVTRRFAVTEVRRSDTRYEEWAEWAEQCPVSRVPKWAVTGADWLATESRDAGSNDHSHLSDKSKMTNKIRELRITWLRTLQNGGQSVIPKLLFSEESVEEWLKRVKGVILEIRALLHTT